MANLYDLSAGYEMLLNMYDAAESDEERENITAMLIDTGTEIEDRAEAYAKLIRMKDAEKEAFNAEANRLRARAKAAENLVNRLKAALLDSMKLTGMEKIETSIGSWRVQTNDWTCDVIDWTKVPMEFREPQPDKVDKVGLKKRFKQTGELIDGCEFRKEQSIRFR